MKFATMCGPLQVYVLICLISLLIQLHNTYTKRTFSWVTNNKVKILIAFIFNFTLFVFWGRIINSLCMSQNKGMAWVLIFAPLILTLFTTLLVLGGDVLYKVGDIADGVL
tara:strand:- start:699 stop:1028 length:330 start_codon:yes stop_codon:yes gene_type:complete